MMPCSSLLLVVASKAVASRAIVRLCDLPVAVQSAKSKERSAEQRAAQPAAPAGMQGSGSSGAPHAAKRSLPHVESGDGKKKRKKSKAT